MGVLFYAAAGNGTGVKLQDVLVQAVSREKVETFPDLELLSKRLCCFPSCMSIVVLLAATREDLAELLSLKPLLEDTRVLIVLPDGRPETVRMAHVLTPRFLTYSDSDFSDLFAVIRKMTGQG